MNPSADPILQRLIVKLSKNEALSPHESRLTVQFLKRLIETGRARTAASPRPTGARRLSIEQLMALDYAAQNEKLGGARAARRNVAEAWSALLGNKVKQSAVTDAFTTHESFATKLLASVIRKRTGRPNSATRGRQAEVLTRDAALDAVSNDLRNKYRLASRKR